MRQVSYTEISKALRCEASWDFSYGGHIAGGQTFRLRRTSTTLSAGKAWGTAVAMWHQTNDLELAGAAILGELDDEVQRQKDMGLEPDESEYLEAAERVYACLEHYAHTQGRFAEFGRVEKKLMFEVAPGWEFVAYIDGHMHRNGVPFIVENKFRASLTDREIIRKGRQWAWYAVAYRREYGIQGPVNVLVEETLNRAPQPPKILKSGKVSSDKDQYTTKSLYLAACESTGTEPDMEKADRFDKRVWTQRVELVYSQEQLDEAERELQSAVMLIDDLDSGARYPIRCGTRTNCQSCDYAPICLGPESQEQLDNLYESKPPKRLRESAERGV